MASVTEVLKYETELETVKSIRDYTENAENVSCLSAYINSIDYSVRLSIRILLESKIKQTRQRLGSEQKFRPSISLQRTYLSGMSSFQHLCTIIKPSTSECTLMKKLFFRSMTSTFWKQQSQYLETTLK